MDITLTPEEVRVLGSLLEKERVTPEYYPLSLNALVNACNQKTSRSPVVAYGEETVLAALAGLEKKRLVWQTRLTRVPKYEQSFVRNTKLAPGEAVVLCILMLRGPQTAGEIRAHSERLFDFHESEKLAAVLDDLTEAGYIAKLPRLPGRKEQRYAHLFSGMPIEQDVVRPGPGDAVISPAHDGSEAVARVQEEIEELRRDYEEFKLRVSAFMEQFR